MLRLAYIIARFSREISAKDQLLLLCGLVAQCLFLSFLMLDTYETAVNRQQRTTWTELEARYSELTSRRQLELQRLAAMSPQQAWDYEPNPTLLRWRNVSCMDCAMPSVAFEIGNYDRCETAESLNIIILINSNGPNLKLRQAIRRTWGHQKLMESLDLQYVFLLGTNTNNTVNILVHEEMTAYRDIVMGKFPESYTNLCVKTLMGMRWASRHCSKAKYMFKTDDDLLLNIHNMTTMIRRVAGNDKTIYGNCMGSGTPHRCPFSKWYTPFRYYPYRWYGSFCLGSAFIMHNSCAKTLYEASRDVSYFHVEDVYMSALITAHAQVNRRFIGGLQMSELPTATCPFQQGSHATLLSNVTSFYSLWYRHSDDICEK